MAAVDEKSAVDEKETKTNGTLQQRAADCEYLLGKDGYFFSTMRVAATHDFLMVWHILKNHAPFPKTSKGIFRAITINASPEFNDALAYISKKRTVNATSLVYDLNAHDKSTSLPYDRVHQIRKIKIDISLQTNDNKIDLMYADAKTLNDVVASVAIMQTIKNFKQLHVMRLRKETLDVGILLLGLFYSHVYPIVFPWTDDVFMCAKNKTARDCNKTFDIFAAECGVNKFNFADALVANKENAAVIEAHIAKCREEIAANDTYDSEWIAEFI